MVRAAIIAACLALAACVNRPTLDDERSQLTCHTIDGTATYQANGLGWKFYQGAWYTWMADDTQRWYRQSMNERCEVNPI